LSLLIITFVITLVVISNMATFNKGSSCIVEEKNLSIPAKTGNLKISLREEISRFLCKYRRMKKLEIHKSREKTRV
jgi:hypothetical protein